MEGINEWKTNAVTHVLLLERESHKVAVLKAFRIVLNVCLEEFVQGVGAVKEFRL